MIEEETLEGAGEAPAESAGDSAPESGGAPTLGRVAVESPALTAIEARIVGCLAEKNLAVPDSYPLTLNSLLSACNQKNSRDPMMNLTGGETMSAAESLADRGWLRIERGGRADRYAHRLRDKLNLERAEQALMAILLLRAPSTLNELKMRSERMANFADDAAVIACLDGLINRRPPLVVRIAPAGGRREERYANVLRGDVADLPSSPSRPAIAPVSDLEKRVAALEEQMAVLLAAANPPISRPPSGDDNGEKFET